MDAAPRLTLKPGRERSLLRRHPWIFSGAIAEVRGAPQSGDTVDVRAADGRFLAWAAYSPASQIRARVGLLAEGREVLNGFSYSGGFTLSALAGGARSVLSIDSSAPALELAKRNLALNGVDPTRAEWLEADVFGALRSLRAEDRQFDLIVLDPPKFAPTPKDAERAARGYKDINLNALKLLPRGGLLATFSCSGGVSPELFQKIVAGAAADAGASLLLRERYRAAPDHPVRIEFPEGEYLKGLLLERL